MPGNFIKEDLRVAKTYKALQNAMTVLLTRRKFKQLTINDLCEEALTSRAAFYVHFKDKYDLLKCWFDRLLTEFSAADIEETICCLVYDKSKIMQNIINEAEAETLGLLHNFIRMLLCKFFKMEDVQKESFEHSLLLTFCDGGIYEIIIYMIKKDYSQESETAKQCLHNLLKTLFDFETNIITNRGKQNERCHIE